MASHSSSTPAAAARPRPTLRRRASGVLLHVSSLPGGHGVGDLGPEAHRFADFLAEHGQGWWQMLPVGPIGAGESPYSSPSSFAGNPLFVSLDSLVEDGLLEPGDLAGAPKAEGAADYGAARAFKLPLLRRAFQRFSREARGELWEGFRAFYRVHSPWLDDYALYCALRDARGGKPWTDWEPELRAREFRRWRPEVLKEIGEATTFHQFVQYLFHRQWATLRRHCESRGVGLIGDVPIFVAYESADVWAAPEIFRLDDEGRPTVVTGVPPDYFSETGQLWGNPHYRWDVLKERGYDWWIARLRQAGERFHSVRLDHFIGFVRAWEVAYGAKDAREGRWAPGPGEEFFRAVMAALPELELIAEDLGSVTGEVIALRDALDLPGMRVLQFAFGDDQQADSFLPHNYPRRCVAYTGTHDNDTTLGWFNDPGTAPGSRRPEQIARERENCLKYLHGQGREIHWDMIGALERSTADTVIIQAQDLLGLGTEARMNRPGTAEGNWTWRLRPGEPGEDAGRRLAELSAAAGRRIS